MPDFRSSNGLFNTLKSENKLKASGKHLFDASVYQTDDSTSSFHEMVRTLSTLVSNAEPTAFHQMLATLASEGRLLRLYTQNVDGIDTSLPPLATRVPLDTKGPWPQTVQLHGSLEKMVCSKCQSLKDFDSALFNGPIPPSCVVCLDLDKVRTESAGKRSHGIGKLRPRMVLYNEHNPDDEAIGTVVKADLRARPDAVIVVGTSMEIPGVRRIVREMCGVVRGRKDGVAIWINRGPPPIAKEFEDCWDLIVAGDCDKVAHRANMRRWNDEGNEYKECSELEAEQAKQKARDIKVVVEPKKGSPSPERNTTPKKRSTPAMLTPAESPITKATKPSISLSNFPPLNLSGKTNKQGFKEKQKYAGKKNVMKKSCSAVSKSSKGSKLPKSSCNMKINAAFKVTKYTAPAPFTPKKGKVHPATERPRPHHPSPTGPEKARKLLESLNASIPMASLSPTSAKSNGPLSPPRAEFPSLKVAVPLKVEIPPKPEMPSDFRRLKRMSEEIVSPTGTMPSGMAAILH